MTTTDHHELTAALSALADEPAPPAAFDVTTSITCGRARLHRRYRATIGTVALLTVATVTGGLLLESRGGGAPAGPAAPPATSATTGAPTATGHTPLTTEVKFGWLPDWADGERGVSYASGTDGADVRAGEGGLSGRSITLDLLPAGVEPTLSTSPGQAQAKVPAPDVNGRTAYWVVHPTAKTFDNSSRALNFLTPSGRWARIIGWRGGSDISDDVLLRVAAGVQTGKWDVPLPFWLTGLPDSFKLTSASLRRRVTALPWVGGATFSVGGAKVSLIVAPDLQPKPGEIPPWSPTAKCRVDQGFKVCAEMSAGGPTELAQPGGLAGLLDRVHVTGADESTWTTEFLR
ncbi:hypothetical protein ACH4E7_40620 [Kitasatospora sp. NPDC018058]|uniref:hypothetical protein n=1 Tax=Kitasatospora sp. NPDC018058 TaxID=3364025 RepID=UPI0037C04C35